MLQEKYQQAILYFISNPDVSIKETALKYNVNRITLGEKLTALNLNNSKQR